MIVLPAIDLKDGKCVRLYQGDYSTAEVVAPDPVSTARRFQEQGAHWIHMVDLDGAKDGKPKNTDSILQVLQNTDVHIQVGGGIRTRETVERYLEQGVSRVVLGSVALRDPSFVREAVKAYGKRIAVGIDALDGKAAAEGWTEQSEIGYLELARRMEDAGVSYIIFTDISHDGMMNGPNLVMLDKLNQAVSCNIIASGGVSSLLDLVALHDLGLYGAIAGRSVYNGALDLRAAIIACHKVSQKRPKTASAVDDEIDRYFQKSELLPVIVQEDETDEVLMLAYMNRESLKRSFETGETWFYSRSRKQLWHKGETSGHIQKIVSAYTDCDDDTLLLRVKQTGAACHTGNHSCFFQRLTPDPERKEEQSV